MKRFFVVINFPHFGRYCMRRILYFEERLVDRSSQWDDVPGNQKGGWIGLWYLTPLSTIFQLYRGVSFIDGENLSTWGTPPTCRKSLTNFIT